MSLKRSPANGSGSVRIYQIKVQGHLTPPWADWFNGLTVTPVAGGITLLTGPLADQAALYGVLKKVRNLGMPLLAVNCSDIEEANEYHGEKQ